MSPKPLAELVSPDWAEALQPVADGIAGTRHDCVAYVLAAVFDGHQLFSVHERDVERQDVR